VTPPHGWLPRLVALDIDGTLCAEAGESGVETIRPAVRAALSAARVAGAHVVLCSGRTMLAVARFVAALGGWPGPAICSNGAVWLDGSGAVLRQQVFELASCVGVLQRSLPGAVFAAEEVGLGNRATATFHDFAFAGHNRLVDVAELIATPTTRLTVNWPGRSVDELAAALTVAELADIQYSVFGPDAWMVASPAGVTKGSALEELRIHLGVSAADTLAIGDGTNDLEMLAWAAHGVAMGQASAAVRAVADEVTAPVHEDGAALVLDRWFGSGTESGAVSG
jgi:Cof subfamily protein (haloacid dehalogenase superfamily)